MLFCIMGFYRTRTILRIKLLDLRILWLYLFDIEFKTKQCIEENDEWLQDKINCNKVTQVSYFLKLCS